MHAVVLGNIRRNLNIPTLILQSRTPLWDVLTGRRDGNVSLASEVNGNIPSPFSDFSTLKQLFVKKGLNVNDLVALSGIYTIKFLISHRPCYNYCWYILDQAHTPLGLPTAALSRGGSTTSQAKAMQTLHWMQPTLNHSRHSVQIQPTPKQPWRWILRVQARLTVVISISLSRIRVSSNPMLHYSQTRLPARQCNSCENPGLSWTSLVSPWRRWRL